MSIGFNMVFWMTTNTIINSHDNSIERMKYSIFIIFTVFTIQIFILKLMSFLLCVWRTLTSFSDKIYINSFYWLVDCAFYFHSILLFFVNSTCYRHWSNIVYKIICIYVCMCLLSKFRDDRNNALVTNG